MRLGRRYSFLVPLTAPKRACGLLQFWPQESQFRLPTTGSEMPITLSPLRMWLDVSPLEKLHGLASKGNSSAPPARCPRPIRSASRPSIKMISAIMCGSQNSEPQSNCLGDDTRRAAKESGLKVVGVSGNSACGVDANGNWWQWGN